MNPSQILSSINKLKDVVIQKPCAKQSLSKLNHLKVHCFIGNSKDRGIQRQSQSISTKIAQTNDMRTDKNGVMETFTLQFLPKQSNVKMKME